MLRETVVVLCPGSHQPTRVVHQARPPHRFECAECGRDVGAVLSLGDPRWITPEHYSHPIGGRDDGS